MDHHLTNGNSLSPEKDTAQIKIGMVVLSFFLFLRPITVAFHHIGSVSILDLFGIGISFLFLFGLLVNINKLRIDFTSLVIAFFCLYSVLSFLWGGTPRDIVRTILPFLPFFLAKATITDDEHATTLLLVLALGYILPILGSVISIGLGVSATMVTGSMVVRQAGLASGVHTQAHLMLFLSFAFALYCLLEKEKKLYKYLYFLIFLGSLFCIYKTLTRTVIMGGLFFWFTHLFFWKRKLFLLLVVLALITSVLLFDDIKKLITQEDAISQQGIKKGFDLNAAGSGRIGIWKHNLIMFEELPFTSQLLGVGLGNELEVIPGTINKKWNGSHNDYMSLMITSGAIGLCLYLLLYAALFFSFVFAPISWPLRIFCIAMLFSVMMMNLVSNSYIVRFPMAQLFWFLIGLLQAKFALLRSHSEEAGT